MTTPILELNNVQTYIGQFFILQGVSVSVPPGSITVLLGRIRRATGPYWGFRAPCSLSPARDGR